MFTNIAVIPCGVLYSYVTNSRSIFKNLCGFSVFVTKFVRFLVRCALIRPSFHPFCDKLSHFMRFVHSPSFPPTQAFALGGIEPVDDEDDNDDDGIKKKKYPNSSKTNFHLPSCSTRPLRTRKLRSWSKLSSVLKHIVGLIGFRCLRNED
jgi:hypothetical protein